MTETTSKHSMQLAGLIAGTVIAADVFFLIASHFYEAGKADADVGSARFAFVLLSLLVGVLAYVSAVSTRVLAHGLAAVVGVANVIGGVAAFANGRPPVMAMTLLISGSLLPLLAWRSWRHSRAAWSFLIGVLAVLALVNF